MGSAFQEQGNNKVGILTHDDVALFVGYCRNRNVRSAVPFGKIQSMNYFMPCSI